MRMIKFPGSMPALKMSRGDVEHQHLSANRRIGLLHYYNYQGGILGAFCEAVIKSTLFLALFFFVFLFSLDAQARPLGKTQIGLSVDIGEEYCPFDREGFERAMGDNIKNMIPEYFTFLDCLNKNIGGKLNAMERDYFGGTVFVWNDGREIKPNLMGYREWLQMLEIGAKHFIDYDVRFLSINEKTFGIPGTLTTKGPLAELPETVFRDNFAVYVIGKPTFRKKAKSYRHACSIYFAIGESVVHIYIMSRYEARESSADLLSKAKLITRTMFETNKGFNN